MGLFDIFRQSSPLNLSAVAMPVSPMAAPSTSIQTVVWAEYFGGELGEVTRLSALQIPAIKKARDLLVTKVAGLPLRELEGDTEIDQPWLYSTKTTLSPWHRLSLVADDLLFYDWSLLAVDRDSSGQVTDAVRVAIERWSSDADGRIRVDGKAVSAEEVILIPGSGSGGILADGATTIKGYKAIERSWIGRAQSPIPLTVIQQVTDDPMEDAEIEDLVSTYAAARMSPTGAVAFADNRVEIKALGTVQTDLFENGRNAAVLDVARLTGVPASILDGSQSTATLTYSTTEGRRNEFVDYALPMLLDPIEARLSLDDVSGPGRVIRFDRSSLVTVEAPAMNEPTKD